MQQTIITVGSKNKLKIAAVKSAVKHYPSLFSNAVIQGVEVNPPEFGHPKNIEETVSGAIQRAKTAYQNCTYSVGLEGGLLKVPHTHSGYLETGACAIYDGKNIYIGLAPAFEWPLSVTQLIMAGEADASLAFKKLGLTTHNKLGNVEGGIIGLLTNQRMTRESFTEYSITMALIQMEKRELYSPN